MCDTAVGIKNCKQLFSLRLAFTTQKSNTYSGDDVCTTCCYFFIVNASSGKKSCLQFSIPTESGAGGEGGVSHRLKAMCHIHVEALMVTNWFPYFLPTSLFYCLKRSRLQ